MEGEIVGNPQEQAADAGCFHSSEIPNHEELNIVEASQGELERFVGGESPRDIDVALERIPADQVEAYLRGHDRGYQRGLVAGYIRASRELAAALAEEEAAKRFTPTRLAARRERERRSE